MKPLPLYCSSCLDVKFCCVHEITAELDFSMTNLFSDVPSGKYLLLRCNFCSKFSTHTPANTSSILLRIPVASCSLYSSRHQVLARRHHEVPRSLTTSFWPASRRCRSVSRHRTKAQLERSLSPWPPSCAPCAHRLPLRQPVLVPPSS